MPTYPLPTLAPTVSATGITAPSYNDILLSLVATMQSIFGSDIYLPPDSQDLQMLAAFALAIFDSNEAAIAVYNGFAPTFAQGTNLSALVKINGIQREPPTNSTATVTITGTVGTVINDGIVQDANANLWTLPPVVTIPISGSIDVTATCETAGAIAAPAHTINQIFNPILGWQTADNAAAATVGVNAESDATLRQRQAQSTALPAQTPLQAIFANVANVTGVERSAIYENPTGTTDSNGLPPHSISNVVQGGDITAIATAIEEKKSPGTATYGSTSVSIEDPAGVPITINFWQLALVNVYVAVTITPLTNYVSTTGTALIQAIIDFINSLPIGTTVYYDWIFGPATLYGSQLGLTYRINSLFIGTAPSPTGTSDIAITFNEAAETDLTKVTLTVL
ncbi:MAG TPA: baseplate J/gp47 family protein [Candidatus Binatia bacterium]|nr:baseplate J/gp47 family protein [Candidatus Binatia bacterium]